MRFSVALLLAALGLSQALADEYPTRPITLIVPFPAGGGVDVVGRIVADKLATALGQPVIIDNRGGAAGVIGPRVAARAAPDETAPEQRKRGLPAHGRCAFLSGARRRAARRARA